MKTVCIIQARMGSTRLPGKVGMDIAGKPMLQHVVERAGRIHGVDEVVVATTVAQQDDELVALCGRLGVACTRGSEQDVLSRYLEAARAHQADVVMRVTSDCPLLDPEVSGKVLERFLADRPDYASNALERTYPRGLDIEVMSLSVLEQAGQEAVESADREHVTLYIWRRPQRFHLLSIAKEQDESSHRWTVDTAEDLELVRRLYAEFEGRDFGFQQVLSLLRRNPAWALINAHVEQKQA